AIQLASDWAHACKHPRSTGAHGSTHETGSAWNDAK
ncbi:unnamed protein product, partial [Ectocarpus sp. 13 AM-2016]